MSIVPCVVINNYSSVAHSSDLITVVPPSHDLRILWCILLEPIVCFTEVINNESVSIIEKASTKDESWTTESCLGIPTGVYHENSCEETNHRNKENGHINWHSLFVFYLGWLKAVIERVVASLLISLLDSYH